jgi:pyrroloquinoline quinone biosynthesis protein B
MGSRKRALVLFDESRPPRYGRRRRVPAVELLVPHLPGRAQRAAAGEPATQSSAAVSADGNRWFLLNASPDVLPQLGGLPIAEPDGTGTWPVDGSCSPTRSWITRSASCCCAKAAAAALRHASRLRRSTRHAPAAGHAGLRRGADCALWPGMPTELALPARDPADHVEPFAVPAGPPRFASRDEPGHTVGLSCRTTHGRHAGLRTRRAAASMPACSRAGRHDLLLFRRHLLDRRRDDRAGRGHQRAARWITCRCRAEGGSLAQLAGLATRGASTTISTTPTRCCSRTRPNAHGGGSRVEVGWTDAFDV